MLIVAFEGIDASGKETQAELLVKWLQGKEYNVFPESFPRYHTPIGQIIKGHLTDELLEPITEEAFHMLLEADRQAFMADIEFARSNGCDFIILDRFTLSNIAFGKAKDIDINWLKGLQKKVTQPDITFFVDISPATSITRRSEGRDKHERDTELLHKARRAYTDLAYELNKLGKHVYLIDGELSVNEIHENIKGIVLRHLS